MKRLRGRSLRELRVRSKQELAKLGERTFRLSEGEMSDRAFGGYVNPAHVCGSAEETAAAIINRVRNSITSHDTPTQYFFPSLGQRQEIVARMLEQFPDERREILDRAERAIGGRFDLLGFKNLSFGNPPDWLLEPVSGKRAPLDHWSAIDYLNPAVCGDKKITWELNRHQHFVTLGQAYWLTADERYAEAFIAQAESWMDANPPKRGINWVSSLEIAFRSIAWLWALHLFADSPRLTPQFQLRLLKQFLAHGFHLQSYLSHYFSPNTHLTGEALGLFYLGTALVELRCAEAWRKIGLGIMLDELPRQIRGDGVYFEQTTYYHRYTADFYLHFLILARAANVALPTGVDERLAEMISYLMWITRPDGSSPLIGDDDGGRLIVLGPRARDDFRDTVAIAAALYERGDWKRAAGKESVETLWLLGPDGLRRFASIPSADPITRSRIHRESGYVVMRDGWSKDSSYTLMDCGPHGSLSCGHAHADALSIEFAAVGRTWIIDPGTFTYTADPRDRDWFRSTQSHNTVTVDGESQSVPAGPFSWRHVAKTNLMDFIEGDGFDYVEASHDGYHRLADPVKHTRLVIHPKANAHDGYSDPLPSYLIVRDSLIASERHEYALRYHLIPGCRAFAIENRVMIAEPGGRTLNIAVFGESKIEARIDESWRSRAYGHREPSLVAVFQTTARGPQEFTSFIIPAADGQKVTVDRHRVELGPGRGFRVLSGVVSDFVLISNNGRPAKCGPLVCSGRVGWGRFEDSVFARGFLIGGHRFETGDGYAFRSAAPVNQCALWRSENGIRGSIGGAAFFEVGIGETSRKGEINRTAYEVCRPISLLGADDADWNLVDNQSEAIN